MKGQYCRIWCSRRTPLVHGSHRLVRRRRRQTHRQQEVVRRLRRSAETVSRDDVSQQRHARERKRNEARLSGRNHAAFAESQEEARPRGQVQDGSVAIRGQHLRRRPPTSWGEELNRGWHTVQPWGRRSGKMYFRADRRRGGVSCSCGAEQNASANRRQKIQFLR